jgi:hypothetical protein
MKIVSSIKNLQRTLHQSHTIYIKLTTNELLIAPYKNNKPLLSEAQIVLLTNNEIVNNHIVNLTAIAQHCRNFITTNHYQKPHAVVEASFLSSPEPCATLSIALCLSKCGCHIDRISVSPQSQDLLTFFMPPRYVHIRYWLAGIVLSASALILFIVHQHTAMCNYTHEQTMYIKSLTTDIAQLTAKAQKLSTLEKENAQIDATCTFLATLPKLYPRDVCAALAQSLPATGRIDRITIATDPQQHHNRSDTRSTITLQGYIDKPHKLHTFIKKLAKAYPAHFSLIQLTHQVPSLTKKPSSNSDLYSFILQTDPTTPVFQHKLQ